MDWAGRFALPVVQTAQGAWSDRFRARVEDGSIYGRRDRMKLGGGANRVIAAQLTDLGETATFYSRRVRLEN